MEKDHCILIVTKSQSLAESFNYLPYFNDCYKTKICSDMNESTDFLKKYRVTNSGHAPEIIFLDLDDLLNEGKTFLGEYSNIFFDKNDARIIFHLRKNNLKEGFVLKALGDFEFIESPLTEEKIFNCLIQSPVSF